MLYTFLRTSKFRLFSISIYFLVRCGVGCMAKVNTHIVELSWLFYSKCKMFRRSLYILVKMRAEGHVLWTKGPIIFLKWSVKLRHLSAPYIYENKMIKWEKVSTQPNFKSSSHWQQKFCISRKNKQKMPYFENKCFDIF